MKSQPVRRRVPRTPLRALLGSALILLAGTGSSTAAPGPGALDASFGAKGVVLQSLGNGSDTTAAVASQADGKLLVVGTSTSTVSGTTSKNIVVERFTAAGKLDGSFGAGTNDGSPDGVASLSLGDGEEQGADIAVQADGKILVLGTTTSVNGSANVVVARLNADGSLDKGFGKSADGTPDGVVNLDLGNGNDAAGGLAVLANGKIAVSATSSSSSGSNVEVVRLNADGSLDKSFGADSADGSPAGFVSLSLGKGDDTAADLAVQADGKLVVAANTTSTDAAGSSNIVLARLTSSGALDGSFGTAKDGTVDGLVNLSLSDGNDTADALALQADGKILVVGTTHSSTGRNAAVARFNTNGELDSSFGRSRDDGTPEGVVGISLGSGDDDGAAVALQADGRILIAGTTTSLGGSTNVFVARLAPNGAPDASFGVTADGTPDGFVNVSFSNGNDSAAGLLIQPDGKIVVAGDSVTATGHDIALARLLAR